MNLVLSLFSLGVLFRKLCTFYKIKTTSAPQYLLDLIPQTYHLYNTCATEYVITFYSRIDAFKYSFSQYTVLGCMFLSCHVRVSEWIHALELPECQGTPSRRREVWSLSDYNWTRIQSHLVSKQTLNHLAKLGINSWVLVYELSGSGFESSCSHLHCIRMEQTWLEYADSKTTLSFRNSLLISGWPISKPIYIIHNPTSLTLLNWLRFELSNLNQHNLITISEIV